MRPAVRKNIPNLILMALISIAGAEALPRTLWSFLLLLLLATIAWNMEWRKH